MTLPLLIGIDNNRDTQVIHGHVFVSHTGSGYDNLFGYIKLLFRQHGIQPNIAVIFMVTHRGIVDFDKNPTKHLCSCSEKIRLGQTEDSSFSGKTHIRTR